MNDVSPWAVEAMAAIRPPDLGAVRAACKDRIASRGKDKAVISCQWVLEQLGGTK